MTFSPPVAQPWDTAAIADQALAILRLEPTDADAQRVVDAAVVACALLDQLIDGDPAFTEIPEPVNYGAVLCTIELYKRKDAPFGVLDAWSVDAVPIRLSSDTLRQVRRIVFPYKQRFGVA